MSEPASTPAIYVRRAGPGTETDRLTRHHAQPKTTTEDQPAATRRRHSGRLLTKREQQVLEGMSHGRSNAEIGRDLDRTEDTIKSHARRLYQKLGAADRAHAVAIGFRMGLLNVQPARPAGADHDH